MNTFEGYISQEKSSARETLHIRNQMLLLTPLNCYQPETMVATLTNSEIRRRNLKFLIDTKFDGVAARFAEKLGIRRQGVSRYFMDEDNEHSRNIGDDFARKIEETLNLPSGYMDSLAENNDPLDVVSDDVEFPAAIQAIFLLLDQTWGKDFCSFSPNRRAQEFLTVYNKLYTELK